MATGKINKRLFRTGVLVSTMAFYFSCGKDVFPPDSPPGDLGSEISTATVSLIFRDRVERFSHAPCPLCRVPHSMYPLAFSNSAMRIAPPAAPRTVLCDSPTKRQSNTLHGRSLPTTTAMPFSASLSFRG